MFKGIKYAISIVLFVVFCAKGVSQTDDLMIVEYVDWNPGSGFGVKIYNPTGSTINLSSYTLDVYNNGATSPNGSYTLSGSLAAGASIIVGNTPYCNTNCAATCNLVNSNAGVNGNDAIALRKSGAYIDMVGLVGYDPGSQGWKVDNTSNALLWHKIVRNSNNCTRYTSTSGSGANSWPNSSSVNVTGWTVSGYSCIASGFSLSGSGGVPKINVPSTDTVVCNGTSINFTANAAYKWYRKNNNGTATLNNSASALSISFNQSGTDTVIIEGNSCGVASYDTLVVKVGAPFSFTFGADSTYCGQINALLNPAISNATYVWQDNSTAATYQPTVAGTYWAKATRDNCTAADTIVIGLQNAVVPKLGADTAICAGDSISKSFTCTGCSYLWSTNQSTPAITIKQAGSYWLEVTDGNCKTRDTVVITIKQGPAVALGNDTAVCAGDSLLKTYNCTSCKYLWNTGDTTASIYMKQAGSYWLRADNGCVNSDTITLSINQLPLVSLGADTSFCAGDSISKSYTCVGCSYLWSTTETTPNITIKQAGNYWLQVNNGCKNSDTVTVTVKQPPMVSLGTDTSVCAGDSIIKSFSCAGCTYNWSTTDTVPSISIKQSGVYWLKVTNAGCSAFDTIIVASKPSPVFSLGSDTSICSSGGSYTLKTPLNGAAKQWSTGAASDSLVVTTAGVYWARLTANGCSYIDSVIIRTAITHPRKLKDTSVCSGQSALLDATITGATYLWDDNSTQATRVVSAKGKYKVVFMLNGCAFADSAMLNLDSLPAKPVLNDITVCEDAVLTIDGTTKGATSYIWNTGETTPLISPDSGGIYVVAAINKCGAVLDTMLLTVEDCNPPYIPNVFTPNGDSLNDGFYIDYKNVNSFKIEIYSRWGERVFESNSPSFIWRGDYNGQLVPSGVYFYIISSQSGIGRTNNTSGTITLIR